MYRYAPISIALILIISFYQMKPNSQVTSLQPLTLGYTDKANLQWANEPWTGDEQPYHRIRVSLENLKNRPEELDRQFKQYRDKALRSANDPLAQFAWAYSAYLLAGLNTNPYYAHEPKLDGVIQALDKAPSPKTFEYARVRYLILRGWSPSTRLEPLAKRLHKHDPDDQRLKYVVCIDYTESDKLSDIKYGVKLAEELVSAEPTKACYHFNLAKARFNLWSKTMNRADINRCIDEYREYIRITPRDDPYRKEAQRMLKILPGIVAEWEAKRRQN